MNLTSLDKHFFLSVRENSLSPYLSQRKQPTLWQGELHNNSKLKPRCAHQKGSVIWVMRHVAGTQLATWFNMRQVSDAATFRPTSFLFAVFFFLVANPCTIPVWQPFLQDMRQIVAQLLFVPSVGRVARAGTATTATAGTNNNSNNWLAARISFLYSCIFVSLYLVSLYLQQTFAVALAAALPCRTSVLICKPQTLAQPCPAPTSGNPTCLQSARNHFLLDSFMLRYFVRQIA